MIRKIIRLENIIVLTVAALLICILMVRPIVGVADNGDFSRIMGLTGLQYIPGNNSDRYFDYVNREYKIDFSHPPKAGYLSTEVILVFLSEVLNSMNFFHWNTYDIRYLAFTYSCIFLLSLYLIVSNTKQRIPIPNIVMLLLIPFIFADAGYLSYFNSFYGEAVSFISLFLVLGSAMNMVKQPKPSMSSLVLFFSGAIILTGAKAQNAPIGLLLVLFSIGLLRLRRDRKWKNTIRNFCIIITLLSISLYVFVPSQMRICNKYQSVFFGILKDSPTPARDLEELGMDQSLATLAGTNYFMKDYPMDIKSPAVSQEIGRKVSPAKVALFYLRHPSRFLWKLDVTAKNGFKLIQGFGNYEKTVSSQGRQIIRNFRVWSDFKMNFLPHSLLFVALLFLGYYIVLSVYYLREHILSRRIYLETFMLVGLIGATQFVIPILCDGEADISKHLFLFNICFDIIFAISVIWLAYLLNKGILFLRSLILKS